MVSPHLSFSELSKASQLQRTDCCVPDGDTMAFRTDSSSLFGTLFWTLFLELPSSLPDSSR